MSLQTWRETLVNQTVSGSFLATFTTAKTVIPSNSLVVLPAGYMQIGRILNVKVLGAISNIVTTPGTVTFQVMLGTTGTIVAFTTAPIQLSSTAHTTLPFWLDIELTCRSVGNSTNTNFMGQGLIASQCVVATAVADSTTSHGLLLAPNVTPAIGVGFDSTVANVLDFWAGFSINNVGNAVQIHQYKVTSEN